MQHIISALQDLWSNIQSVVGVEVLNTILAVTMILFVYFLFIRLFLTLIKSSKNVKLMCDIMAVLICGLVVVGNLLPSIKIDKTDRSVITNDTMSITQNGTYDVESYAEAVVNVPGLVPSGTKTITSNGTYDVSEFASASVNVASSVPPSVDFVRYPSISNSLVFTEFTSGSIDLNLQNSPNVRDSESIRLAFYGTAVSCDFSIELNNITDVYLVFDVGSSFTLTDFDEIYHMVNGTSFNLYLKIPLSSFDVPYYFFEYVEAYASGAFNVYVSSTYYNDYYDYFHSSLSGDVSFSSFTF